MNKVEVEAPTYPGWVIRIMDNVLVYLKNGWKMKVTVDTETGGWVPERWNPFDESPKPKRFTELIPAFLEGTEERVGSYPVGVHRIGKNLVDLAQRGRGAKAVIRISNGNIQGYHGKEPQKPLEVNQ